MQNLESTVKNVLYKSTVADKSECPEIIRNYGIHVPMEKTVGTSLYWGDDSIKKVIG